MEMQPHITASPATPPMPRGNSRRGITNTSQEAVARTRQILFELLTKQYVETKKTCHQEMPDSAPIKLRRVAFLQAIKIRHGKGWNQGGLDEKAIEYMIQLFDPGTLLRASKSVPHLAPPIHVCSGKSQIVDGNPRAEGRQFHNEASVGGWHLWLKGPNYLINPGKFRRRIDEKGYSPTWQSLGHAVETETRRHFSWLILLMKDKDYVQRGSKPCGYGPNENVC